MNHRCKTICSIKEEVDKETEHIKQVQSISGYTRSAWVTANKPRSPTVSSDPSKTKTKGSITLPYVGNTSDAIARILRKSGIMVHLKPYNTLRSYLVHPKDKVELTERVGLVYYIQCRGCNASYVGETERNLQKRIKEHHRTTSKRKNPFSIDRGRHTLPVIYWEIVKSRDPP